MNTRGAHAMKGAGLSEELRGRHVMKDDPLRSIELRARHARRDDELVAALGLSLPDAEAQETAPVGVTPEIFVPPEVPIATRSAVRRTHRARRVARRESGRIGVRVSGGRRRLAALAGGAGAAIVALGAGTAFAYMLSNGSGSGQATAAGPVTVAVTATTGSADLLPGRSGAVSFALHNRSGSAATFDQIRSGAVVVSDNTDLCGSGYVSIAQELPFTLATPLTVGPGDTSGTQVIPSLVELAPNAPSSCQGVTFTVSFSLSGRS